LSVRSTRGRAAPSQYEFLFTFTPSIRYTALTILFINQTANRLRPGLTNPKQDNLNIVRRTNMKTLMIAIAFVGATATASAFAQSAPAAAQQPVAATQVASNATPSVGQAGQWVPPTAEANGAKTRAQVYQELVQSEKDGELNYLNSTIYSH
jgi:hypothetical protein